jgi:hypothetical protein
MQRAWKWTPARAAGARPLADRENLIEWLDEFIERFDAREGRLHCLTLVLGSPSPWSPQSS